MQNAKNDAERLISQVPPNLWKSELEKTSSRYHFTATWAAIAFNPVFAVTDYFNAPDHWKSLLIIRLAVSIITLSALISGKKYRWPSYGIVCIPFMLISLQNAYTYKFITADNLLGHNLNYIALWIGSAMFLVWKWTFSVIAIFISILATAFFVHLNANIGAREFFVNGGLLLLAVALFMAILIKARYDLTIKEIKARLALQLSNEEIKTQAKEINRINENLEALVVDRTKELKAKNAALEEYAFINAHKLRSPVASILGLTNLMKKIPLHEEARIVMDLIHDSTEKLDSIVRSITKAIEKGDKIEEQ